MNTSNNEVVPLELFKLKKTIELLLKMPINQLKALLVKLDRRDPEQHQAANIIEVVILDKKGKIDLRGYLNGGNLTRMGGQVIQMYE